MTSSSLATVPTSDAPASNVLAVIARASRDESVDIDKMERLLQMQERILARESEMAFNSALARMQNELPVIEENGVIRDRAGRVQSRYPKFEDISEAVKPILREHGFAISFRTAFEDGAVIVTGVLRHSSGHREESSIKLPADVSGNKNSVQAWGSSIAYGKRYAMNALLNITSRGEDNDGQGGEPQQPEQARAPARSPQSAGGARIINEGQVRLLRARLNDAGMSAEDVCRHFNVESITKLPFEFMNEALAYIADPERAAIRREAAADSKE